MRLKRLLGALALSAILAAVMAGSAMANVEHSGEWHVSGSKLTGSEAMECERGSGGFVLTGAVGTTEIPVILSATGVECVNASISNDASGAGTGNAELVFTGVTVAEPSNCEVEGGKIESKPVHSELYMDSSDTGITFDKFEPAEGYVNLAVVHLRGGSCPVTGNKPIKGYLFGQAEKRTNEEGSTQALEFSTPVDETAGSALEFAGHSAHLSGQSLLRLASRRNFGAGTSMDPGGQWFVNGERLTGSEAANCAAAENLTLSWFIGGTEVPVVYEATGIECVEGSIFNDESGAATGDGSLVFTGVTLAGALGEVCSVRNESITTVDLRSELYMDSGAPEAAFEKLEPAPGRENIAVVHTEGASCPLAGNRPLKGYVFGELVNGTGVSSQTLPLRFSTEVDRTAGSALAMAGEPAYLAGEVVGYLSSLGEVEAVK